MKKLFILSLFVTCTLSSVGAQEISAVSPADSAKVSGDTLKMPADMVKTSADTQKVPADKVKISKNFIKFNITSAIIKN